MIPINVDKAIKIGVLLCNVGGTILTFISKERGNKKIIAEEVEKYLKR